MDCLLALAKWGCQLIGVYPDREPYEHQLEMVKSENTVGIARPVVQQIQNERTSRAGRLVESNARLCIPSLYTTNSATI